MTTVADPAGVLVLDDATVGPWLPSRPARAHKGTFGKLLIVAGSLDHLGAGLLAAHAAGRGGAGLVTLALPGSLQPVAAGRLLEVMTLGLPETEVAGEVDAEAAVERLLDAEHDALVVGPGLRPGLATVDLVVGLLASGSPAVVDAEALNSLASLGDWPGAIGRRCVLTPHLGEFARLRAGAPALPGVEGADLVADDAARARVAGEAAARWGQVVVLKGARTVVASPDGRVARAPFENPALASGGTGDVLAGVLGALLAQGCAPFEAACCGVYLHGVAGDVIRERLGEAGLLADDLPDEIARARRRLAAMAERRTGGRRLGFGLGDA